MASMSRHSSSPAEPFGTSGSKLQRAAPFGGSISDWGVSSLSLRQHGDQQLQVHKLNSVQSPAARVWGLQLFLKLDMMCS